MRNGRREREGGDRKQGVRGKEESKKTKVSAQRAVDDLWWRRSCQAKGTDTINFSVILHALL